MKALQNEFLDLDKSLLPWLGRTMKALDFVIADTFANNGLPLTRAQMILLRRLTMNNGIPQNNLAYITNRDKTSLTRLINTMEKKGLVKRQSSKNDKRINLVFISAFGKETLTKAFPVLNELTKKVQKNIEKSDLETTIKVLKQISVNINADELTAPLTHSK